MNLISNIETNSTNSWNQPTSDTNASQWLHIPNAANQASNLNLSTSNQQTNQSATGSEHETNASSNLMNEAHLPKNWSQIVDTSNSTNTNQNSPAHLDSPTQSNDFSPSSTNDPLTKNLIKDDKFNNVELYSENWGNVPINQNTPWEIPQSQQSQYQASPREVVSCNGVIDNSWKYSSTTTGTDIWEANIRKKSTDQSSTGDLSQNVKNATNWNANQITNPMNHHGGVWGEDDQTTAQSINNNNWMNEKQWNKQGWNESIRGESADEKLTSMNNNSNKNANDSLFNVSTWMSDPSKSLGWQDTDSTSGGLMTDMGEDTSGNNMWRRPNGNQNPRWKESNEMLYKMNNGNKLTMNNINLNVTNQQCANNLTAPMQNGFSTSPGVLRLPPSSANPMAQPKVDQWNNKVQTMQPNNPMNKQWIDQSGNWNSNDKNLNAMSNGQPTNGMFWNHPNDQLNAWNKQSNSNVNDDWKSKKEMIQQSQQFKLLESKGFRKESIENALRNSNMNIKDAIDELRADALKENCNDLDKRKNSGFTHPSSLPPNSSISNRNTSQFNNQMSQQPNQMFRNNLNNNTKAPNAAANAMLQDKRLGNLVQQIQLAVQTGHLNAQILNQPLSANTIQLIYQLLQHIKNLQTLQLQATPNMNKNIGSAQSDLNVQITMIKQRISNLQNQIKLQQAVFINQQQTNQTVPTTELNNGLSINPNTATMPDFNKLIPSPDSPNDFRDSLPGTQQQQSRLSTWKNSPSTNDGFSRAPGSIKNAATTGQPSGQWPSGSFSSNEDACTQGWLSDTNELANALSNMNVQSTTTTTTTTFNINDSVPEFEPGKPWKGTQMKSSDDDPHLTPGSVNRSILSLNNFNNWPTKNTNLQQTSAPTTSALSNTWTFNNVPMNNSSTSPNWNGFTNESSTSPVETLWQQGNKIKGPPPGLSPNKDIKMKSISSYLLIKNLTPQLDPSTLRTLCQQHGPLQIFNILNNGVALVKYKSKEEAIKAQSALNNCFLSNTTILVDLIAESEVQNYVSGQVTSNNLNSWNNTTTNSNVSSNGIYRNGQSMVNSNPWRANNSNQITSNDSQWTFNGSSNLWNNSIDAPSVPINNLLPGDLLNGEST